MAHSTRGWCVYETDNGGNVSIKVDDTTATFNGATPSQFPVGPPWGYLGKDLRHIRGVDGTGARARMTVFTQAGMNGIVIGTTTFPDSKGNTYTVTSKIGEAEKANHQK